MNKNEIINRLMSLGKKENVDGMARYGITAKKVFGVSTPEMQKIAKEIGKNQEFSLELWKENVYELRIIAGMIGDPDIVTEQQMDSWVNDFDSWAVCDSVIMNLFEKTSFAWDKAVEWQQREKEFVKRAGFVMMARLAVSDKKAPDEKFYDFFNYIIKESTDERNMVKKAVNWALRQIGKRNRNLNGKAIAVSEEIYKINSKSARWIASDALRELKSEPVQKRLKK
jgi:3-methyladenine DNA glycosylase AlkD